MEEISSTYWMIIFGFISSFICLVLLYLALLLRESKEVVKSSKNSILRIERLLDDLESTVNIAKGTVEEISNMIIKPFRAIAGVIGSVSNFLPKDRVIEEKDSIDDLLNE